MNKNISLKQEKRQRFLKNLIKEGILNVLVEQETQQVSAVPPATTPPAIQTNVMDPNTSPVTQPPAQPTAPVTAQKVVPVGDTEMFTVDMMIDKLNVLRGAKSFTDPEIYGKMTTFFNELTDEQKTSLKWMLSELVKITDASPNTPGVQNTVQPPTQGNQGQGTPMPTDTTTPAPVAANPVPVTSPEQSA